MAILKSSNPRWEAKRKEKAARSPIMTFQQMKELNPKYKKWAARNKRGLDNHAKRVARRAERKTKRADRKAARKDRIKRLFTKRNRK